jgi:outer membrane protein TolC
MTRSLLVLLVFFGAVGSAAGQAPPIPLTLDEAITRGIAASHRLDEFSARQEAARAVEDQREAAARPQVAVMASYMRTNHIDEFSVPNATGGLRVIYPDIPNSMRSRVDLQWPIYTAGRLGALARAAGAEAEATVHDREAARADLKLEITRSFWAVITARAALDVVRQALERTRAHLADVRNQLSVGLIPPSDVLTVEAQEAHQRVLSIEAANIVETASADFRRLAGLDQDVPFELIADLSAVRGTPASGAGAQVQNAPAAVDFARANRAERKSLQFRISAAAERAAAASAGSHPLVTAGGGYDVARPNPKVLPLVDRWKPSWDIGVSLRWTLFDGGRVRAETAEAMAGQRGIEARLRDFDSAVEVEVRQRLFDVNSARASIDAAETGVRAAAEARRVLAERFNAGVATTTDVLDAQVTLLQAELDLTRARATAELAAARLDRALGR